MKKRKIVLPSTPQPYPVGTFIKTEKGYFYIAGETKRYHAMTKRLLDSWNPPRVVETTEAAVKNFRIVAKLKYRDGSLIYNYADAKIYLVSEGKRRHVVSPDVLPTLGAVWSDVVYVSSNEANLHEEGKPLI